VELSSGDEPATDSDVSEEGVDDIDVAYMVDNSKAKEIENRR
jgi:hypothetical protein